MTPQRLSIKIYFSDGGAIDPPRIVPLFHAWIRDRTLEGVLVDVADYKHVHEGPATVLIGHEADYAVDLSEGRPGLTITRKRPRPAGFGEDVRGSLRRLLLAARALRRKPDPHPSVDFRTDDLRIEALDRLRFSNTPENAASLGREAEAALREVYAGAGLRISSGESDARQPLTLRVSAPGAPDLDRLLERLGGAGAADSS